MSGNSPPRLAQALLRLVIRGDDQVCVLGDLEEMFASVASKSGTRRAAIWFWKEAIVTATYALLRGVERNRVTCFTLLLGVLFAVMMIDLTLVTTHAAFGFFVYAGLMLAMAVYLSVMRVESFRRRFSLTLTAFMTTTILMYWFAVAVLSPEARSISLWGHTWRIGFALALGSVAAAIVAVFSSRRSAPFFVFPFVPVLASACLFLMPHRPSQAIRAMSQVILPLFLLVNWRKDGWRWAFAGADVLLWAGIGWVLFQWWRKTRSDRTASIISLP
jgi:hypothetical protein